MQLVHMDVDQYGTNTTCQLGPLSPGLNAIYGPRGSGKTTLLGWLRQVAAENLLHTHTASDWSAATNVPPRIRGQVELRNRGITFRIDHDRHGQLRTERLMARHDAPFHGHVNGTENPAALSAKQRNIFQALAAATGSADTEASLEALARRIGLEDSRSTQSPEYRQRLLVRERELTQKLSHATVLRSTREELLSQRRELERKLQELAAPRPTVDDYQEARRLDESLVAIESELRDRQRELEQLEREIITVRGELARCEAGQGSPEIGDSYRQQLQQLDDQLNRWRQTLRDLKSHRERVECNATDIRLDKQIGDQLDSRPTADPHAALRRLEMQLLTTQSQLDQLVNRYGVANYVNSYLATETDAPHTVDVRRDANGRTSIAYHDNQTQQPNAGLLPETLRAMQQNLREVCQQLERHEAAAATETLRQQSQQLQRCEAELLQSVEKLIDERGKLLLKIANEYHISLDQLTLSFGQWCQCHDHLSLKDWLMRDEAPGQSLPYTAIKARQTYLDQLQRLETQQRQVSLRCDECRQQLRENREARSSYPTQAWTSLAADNSERRESLLQELADIAAALQHIDSRDRWNIDLANVRRELAKLPMDAVNSERFTTATNRHIMGLVGPQNRQHLIPVIPETSVVGRTSRYYDNINGTVLTAPAYPTEYAVPSAIVRAAMRLAIAEAVAAQGEPITLVLDESLDGLPGDVQRAAVTHLASVARGGQQLLILTGDEQVANLVRTHRGYVGNLHPFQAPENEFDINRQLTAYANDVEAAKWSHTIEREPAIPMVAPRGDYYLTDRSLIEHLPSIEPTAAARCRALGIDRVGDLLDVDPHWLAENLRIDGISSSSIMRWQAEARLLCSVRKLRPFDARVLVGAGIRTPQQLSEMHPSHLLDRVERFLATDRGRNILRSGSSYELTRITSWIASAKTGTPRYQRTSLVNDEVGYDEVEYDQSENSYGDRRHSSAANNHSRPSTAVDYSLNSEVDEFEPRRSTKPNRVKSKRTAGRENRNRIDASGTRHGTPRASQREYPVVRRAAMTNAGPTRRSGDRKPRTGGGESVRLAATNENLESNARLKFYLELASPVVDAPSIGPRMAERLEKIGILTVDQLLAANPDLLADRLNLRRVDAALISSWQDQARLVCRIPNLRGHDAQLLVACEITSPEVLATADAASILSQVLAVAHSTDGQRILRGGKTPDLGEVNDWIAWASSCRSLSAA